MSVKYVQKNRKGGGFQWQNVHTKFHKNRFRVASNSAKIQTRYFPKTHAYNTARHPAWSLESMILYCQISQSLKSL
jgi:hypothetical protein